jgi:hypothetical protein
MPGLASAERFFVRAAGLPSNAPGIARVQTLGLDAAALASLREQSHATITDFPLGADKTAMLTMEQFAARAGDVGAREGEHPI